MKLQDQVAYITGGASGIGYATARLFAQEGAKIALLDYHHENLEKAMAELKKQGADVLGLKVDVSDPVQMKQAAEATFQKWQRLDIVFANAGINGITAPIDEIEPEEWDRTINVNLRGTFLAFRYTVPYLKIRGGVGLITASGQGTRSYIKEGATAYACTKSAQSTFAKKMALELARWGIRVNVICPGSTHTNINDSSLNRNLSKIKLPVNFPEGKFLLRRGKGNKATAEEVAKLALFLASDDACVITGTEIWIDGAMSLFG